MVELLSALRGAKLLVRGWDGDVYVVQYLLANGQVLEIASHK